jgi:hypothetical protein
MYTRIGLTHVSKSLRWVEILDFSDIKSCLIQNKDLVAFLHNSSTVFVKIQEGFVLLVLSFNLSLSVILDSLSCKGFHLEPTFFSIYINDLVTYFDDSCDPVRKKIKVKDQLVVRKDMNVNEHERLSYYTLRHKLKEQLVV